MLEGSEVLAFVYPGGLDAFKQLDTNGKTRVRESTIQKISHDCRTSGRVAIVTGHFMFWNEGETTGDTVYTKADMNTYTHIIYLNIDAKSICEQRKRDSHRLRQTVSEDHLSRWQHEEINQLQGLCRAFGIQFISVKRTPRSLSEVANLVRDFQLRTENHNLQCAKKQADKIFDSALRPNKVKTVLVFDADRTLAPQDTGKLFWELWPNAPDHLKGIFSSNLGYTFLGFRQANFLYEEAKSELDYHQLCDDVADQVALHPEVLQLLKRVQTSDSIRVVVATCGLGYLWERVLKKHGMDHIPAVGGGLLEDSSIVIGPKVKADLVAYLKDNGRHHVFAFGDSPIDIPMLQEADQAFVVIGEEEGRSTSMDQKLREAIGAVSNPGFKPRQILLPPDRATPSLDTQTFPVIELSKPEHFLTLATLRSPIRSHQHHRARIIQASEKAVTKLLTMPTRDANVKGPMLWEAHRQIGQYIASELISELVGLEEFSIPHVQCLQTTGHRLVHEQQTLIVALMRGGEPLALGISEAFPLAMFLYAKQPEDVKNHHLRDMKTVLLVEYVFNEGKTATYFVQHVRKLRRDVDVVVVAGVMQDQAISDGGRLLGALEEDEHLILVTLRVSENKYTGMGVTDTGNRLFNTTQFL